MKEVKIIARAANFTAVNFGKLSDIEDYTLQLSNDIEIPGKVFGGTATNATGAEFSFQSFVPGSETGFLHTHKSHEELYFFLSGNGEFQIDNEIIPVSEGSVVRVAPNGRRSVRNNGTVPLLMLCVQYRGETFTQEDATDGIILHDPVKW